VEAARVAAMECDKGASVMGGILHFPQEKEWAFERTRYSRLFLDGGRGGAVSPFLLDDEKLLAGTLATVSTFHRASELRQVDFRSFFAAVVEARVIGRKIAAAGVNFIHW